MLADKQIVMVVEVYTHQPSDFLHVSARPAYLNYEIGHPYSFRFFDEYTHSDECQLAGLVVDAQGDIKEDTPLYAERLHYRDPHSVELRRAEWMVKCLRRIDRRLDSMYQEFGPPGNYTQHLVRVASILKSNGFIVRTPGYANGDEQFVQASTVGSWIDELTRKLRDPFLQAVSS